MVAPTLVAPVSMVVPMLNAGWLALTDNNCYQVMLLLIAATFSHCLLVTGNCKSIIICVEEQNNMQGI